MAETLEVTDLGGQDYRRNHRDAPHGLQRLHQRRQRPTRQQAANLLLDAVEPIPVITDRRKVLFDGNVVSRMIELKAANPLNVCLRPMAFTWVDSPMPEQKPLEVLAAF